MRVRTRIIGAVLAAVAVFNLSFTVYLVRIERGTALASLYRSIDERGRLLSVVTAGPLYDGDVEQLSSTLDSLFTDPRLVDLALTEREGDISLRRQRLPPVQLGELIADTVVVMRGGDALGDIRIVYSTGLIEQQLIVSRNRIVLASAVLLVVLAIVIVLVARQLTEPIDRLTTAARAMADGDLDRQIERDGAQEIVSLADSFVRMRDAIRQKMADLAEGNAILRQEIAKRERLESQLVQAQKMEAVGRLAGGIAHDFNNLLTVINGCSELVLGELQPLDPLRSDLESIRQAGESAAALTRQLLAFSRKQVFQPVVLDINGLMGRMERMLRRVIGENITLETRLSGGLWPVLADPHQLEQVILNLVINSRDAMPDGGRLVIETNNTVLDVWFTESQSELAPGPFVELTVSDTGRGMDEATRRQVFDPFFTTKGLGTGLGLATVYGIVKQSGGHITCESEPGRGTTFRVYLPRHAGGADDIEPRMEATAAAPAGRTVLVVEDSDAVRALIRQVLTAGGHVTLEARNGEEALDIARRHPGAIDLVLADVILPGMSGREMATRLMAARPDVSLLFMSGYTDEMLGRHGILESGIELLEKPFTMRALQLRVNAILGRAARSPA